MNNLNRSNISLIIKCKTEDIPNIDLTQFEKIYNRVYFDTSNNLINIVRNLVTKYYCIVIYNKENNTFQYLTSNKDIISVIIPVYNCEEIVKNLLNNLNIYISKINELLNNDTSLYEIIIIDNDSDDNTYEIINSYLTNYFDNINIKLVKVSYSNINNLLYYALTKCEGQYITSINNDILTYFNTVNPYLDLYICAHKNFNNIICNKTYKILTNENTKVSNNKLDIYYENETNSELYCLQKAFGEFTKMWYVYKNLPLKEYIGFCHYDRYFNFTDELPNIKLMFSKYDILTLKGDINESIFEHYKNNHITFSEFMDCINILSDEYNYTYNEIFDILSTNNLYICNIFIMKRDDFKKYCEFIYTIITKFLKSKNIKNQNDLRNYLLNKYSYIDNIEFEERFLGYIIERLTSFFIIKNFKRIYNLKVNYEQGNILYKNEVNKLHYFTIATSKYNKYLIKQFETVDNFLPDVEKTYNIISDKQIINNKNINYYHICHLPYPLVTDNKIYYIMDIIKQNNYADDDYFAFFDADTYFFPKDNKYWKEIKNKLKKYDLIFSLSPWIIEYYNGRIWEYENSPENYVTHIINPNPKTYCQGSFFMGKVSALKIFIKYYEELYYAEMNKIIAKGVYERNLPPMGDQQIFNKIIDETINKKSYKYKLNLCVDMLFINNYNGKYNEDDLINSLDKIFFIQKYNNSFKKNIRTD